MIHVSEGISIKLVSKHTLPHDIEDIFVDINLRKTTWLILGT